MFFLNVRLFCSEWTSLLERFLPRQIAITRAKRDWELEILSRYRVMVSLGFGAIRSHRDSLTSFNFFILSSYLSIYLFFTLRLMFAY